MKSISSIIQLAKSAGYSESAKAKFRKQSLSFLRALAKELRLVNGDYSIRFNPGGIAVSGEATLHHNNFYLQIDELGAYWRTCKGQKDYTGGHNRWIVGFGCNVSAEMLIAEIRRNVFPQISA